ncbi:MAG TPA: cysteine desulfurase family protein [Thermoanaerobaculia bacterium]|nr:cysteine desulfurase family protein [Thermoanaerobaculia bacterium]
MIYLDNNASTELDAEVAAAMNEASALYGNPSSLHAPGRRARRAVEEAREHVAALVGARSDEIFFTSGGTEANALAILGATSARPGRVVTTAAEHPSVRGPADLAAGRAGLETSRVAPGPSGALDPECLSAAIGADTALVSVMAANNEYGGVFPVAEAAAAAHRQGALFHTDAVQAAGRIPVDLRAWVADLASFSAHKLHGPKGVGALFVRRGVRIDPLAAGGGQEKGVRPGTENTVGIVGFGAAARLARTRVGREAPEIAALRDDFEHSVLSRVSGARVVGQTAPRIPNTSAILFEGVAGDALLIALDLSGVAVSVGSACSSGTLSPSPAILSLSIPVEAARGVVRFSLSRRTTREELARVAEMLPDLVARARGGCADSRPLAEVASR